MTAFDIATAFLPVPAGLSLAMSIAVAVLRPSRWLQPIAPRHYKGRS